MIELGVNIDHVATVRQARKTYEPDPVWAASSAELGGADCITVHLREDRRHIQDRDVRVLSETVHVKLNLEMACAESVLTVARDTRPPQVTLVPEKREEVTTEGGLDVVTHRDVIQRTMEQLKEIGSSISLFLDPEPQQIEAAAELGAAAVELHTGTYSLVSGADRQQELVRLVHAGKMIRECDMQLHAGHGLNYQNVVDVARIADMKELNIGHSLVARAVFVGLTQAVREMKDLLIALS